MPLQLHGDITGLLDVLEKEQALKHNLQNSFSSPLQFALELLSLPTGVMNTADLPEPVQTPKSEPKSVLEPHPKPEYEYESESKQSPLCYQVVSSVAVISRQQQTTTNQVLVVKSSCV